LIGAVQSFGHNGVDYVPGALILFNADDAGITTGSTEIKTTVIIGQASELSNLSGNYVLIDSVGKLTAPVVDSDLVGSVFSDASTMLIDGTSGSLMAANINVIGETGNTPTDAINVDSWLEVTVNGATKYIPLYD
jgi:hypothetical protein